MIFLNLDSLLLKRSIEDTVVQKIVRQVGAKAMIPENKAKGMESVLTFLQRYHDDGDELLDQNITGDETWVAHITAEKCSSQCIRDTVDLSTRQNLSGICRCGK